MFAPYILAANIKLFQKIKVAEILDLTAGQLLTATNEGEAIILLEANNWNIRKAFYACNQNRIQLIS